MNIAHAFGVVYSPLHGNSTIDTYRFPEGFPRSDPSLTVMRYGVALNDHKGRDADCDAPDVRLWGEDGKWIGRKLDPGYIKEGSYIDITVRHTNPGQPTYAVFAANNNAICLSYIRMIWPNGQNWGWVGNWGRTCGRSWYHANVVLDGKPVYCTWMDANGDAPGDIKGIQIHFPEFNNKGEGYDLDPQWYCYHTETLDFRLFKDPLSKVAIYREPPKSSTDMAADWHAFVESFNETSVLPERRSNVLPALGDKHIVKSTMETHTAARLCVSETSHGPDFASLAEGKVCDMETKELWSICKGEDDENCFNNDTHVIREVKKVGKRVSDMVTWTKNYTKVTIWG